MPTAKCYDIAVNMDWCTANVACWDNVCGGECLPGFYSRLGIGLTYMWGCKHIFAEGSVAAENLMDVCLAIKHSFEASSVFTLG